MVEDKGIVLVSLQDLQPSQLYISQAKLSDVHSRYDFSVPGDIPPIPIKTLDGQQVMTDGHTRAFAAYLAGLEAVPIIDDPDDLDWEAYQICVAWCHAEGIYTIAGLVGRVVNTEDYERLWFDRCREMQSELARERGQ